jgi:hypothetical protein
MPADRRQRVAGRARGGPGAGFTLAAAVLGFFMVTLDAVIVNIALPAIRRDLGGGITACSGWPTGTR